MTEGKKINAREREQGLLLHTIHILGKMAKLRHTMNWNIINSKSMNTFAETDCIRNQSVLDSQTPLYRDAQESEKNTV